MRFRFYAVIQDLQGNVVDNASVYVYKAGTHVPAVVYFAENDTSGVSVVPQMMSGEDGVVSFWLDSSDYSYGQHFDLHFVKGAWSSYLDDVSIIVWDAVHAGDTDHAVNADHAENSDKLGGQDGSYYLSRANHTGTQPPSTISPQGSGSGLDSDKLDGQHGSYYLSRANHTGTQAPSTISPQGSGSGFDSDMLDGQHGTYYLSRANHTGTQAPSTISPQGSGSGLDADKLDGQDGTYYLNRANHTGTQAPGTISPQGDGSGLNSDMVDGYHIKDLLFFSMFFGG